MAEEERFRMDGVSTHFTLMGIWSTMTWAGRSVVIILALMSVWSLTIAFERLWRFANAKRQSVMLAREVTPLLEHHHLEDAMRKVGESRFAQSHLARVLAAGLGELRRDRDLPADFDTVGAARRAIDRETLIVLAQMRRGLGTLATISTTAPFIGLFGTVVGIINAFQGMAATGSGGLMAVSAGIAEALATTAFGLLVAIPAVWLFNYFVGRIESFQVDMSSATSQLVDYFIRNEALSKMRSRPRSVEA